MTDIALEKIVFHPEFSKLLDLKLFSSLFQRLKTIVDIDFSRLILSVVDLIEDKRKNHFLLTKQCTIIYTTTGLKKQLLTLL